MKYHTLFLSKTRKDVANVSSAAVVIGALRVNGTNSDIICQSTCRLIVVFTVMIP